VRGHSAWHYRPYSPLDRFEKRDLPYICRLAPGEPTVELEWFDRGSEGTHVLYYRVRNSGDAYRKQELMGSTAVADQLEIDCDYEIYVAREDGSGHSDMRLFRTGAAVGTVVNYLHPEDETYAYSGRSLCSPSIVKLPSGALLASMDVFAGRAPQNLSLLFRSDDGGLHWHYVCDLFPCFWGKLFWHKGELFMLAHASEYGHLLIGKSQDEGKTWSAPVTILPGAGTWVGRGPHKAPMPVVELLGRLYTGIDYGSWSTGGHGNGLLSIDAESDLMVAENWQCTGFLPYDENWEGAASGKSGGGLESEGGQNGSGGAITLSSLCRL